MSENVIKPATFRLNEDDINKFKDFASQNSLNQQEAFTSLLNTLELNNAKSALGDRAKSIEVFQTTVNSLVKFYINSLEENTTTEDRIREELSLQLTTKDKTIADLQNKLQKVKEDKVILDDINMNLSNKNKELQDQLNKLQKDFIDKDKYIDNLRQQNELLTNTLNEYKEYKEINIKLELENKDLLGENTTLNNSNKQLEDKIKNDADMLDFYKNQIQEQKEEAKVLNKSMLDKDIEYKANVKGLEEKNNQQVLEVEKNFRERLEEQIKLKETEFNNKLELELGKKDLELEKLKNKLENLQVGAKTNKTVK